MKAIFVYGQRDNVRYTLVKGAARDFLRENKIPGMYSASRRGWHVRTERIGDLIARAELAGIRVHIKGAIE